MASEHRFSSAATDADEGDFDGEAVPLLILVVGRSRVNTIVVAKIVERCGMRCVAATPDEGAAVLRKLSPVLTILDGGSDNRDCEGLMRHLKERRAGSDRHMPAVILLSTSNAHAVDPDYSDTVDAIVSKPILPEVLQPVVNRLTAR
ncbi:MAG: response regulator [Rhizobiaceae bacterium]|nr:response regulator [Rhizobiaceae bacterium]